MAAFEHEIDKTSISCQKSAVIFRHQIDMGGFIGRALGWYQPGEPAGFIMATLGAVLLLFVYRRFTARA